MQWWAPALGSLQLCHSLRLISPVWWWSCLTSLDMCATFDLFWTFHIRLIVLNIPARVGQLLGISSCGSLDSYLSSPGAEDAFPRVVPFFQSRLPGSARRHVWRDIAEWQIAD